MLHYAFLRLNIIQYKLSSAHINSFLALVIALTLTLPACSASQSSLAWNSDFLVAARLQDTSNFDQAEQHYRTLRAQAPDPEKKRDIDYELAKILLKRGDKAAALNAFLAIAKHKTKDNPGGKALYEAARIRYEDDVPTSLLLYQQTITEYPDFIASDFSLTALRIHYLREKQSDELLQILDRLFSAVSHTNLSNHILFTRAKLFEDELKDDNEALNAYRQLYNHCQGCSLSDDASWQMAQIYIRHQYWQPATQILNTLAEKVKPSWFIGTYNSPRAADARLLLADINLLYLNDYETAEQHLKRYMKDFPNTTRSDDAAWNLVEIQRLAGSPQSYQKSLDSFVRNYPESRYIKTVQARTAKTSSSTSSNNSGNKP